MDQVVSPPVTSANESSTQEYVPPAKKNRLLFLLIPVIFLLLGGIAFAAYYFLYSDNTNEVTPTTDVVSDAPAEVNTSDKKFYPFPSKMNYTSSEDSWNKPILTIAISGFKSYEVVDINGVIEYSGFDHNKYMENYYNLDAVQIDDMGGGGGYANITIQFDKDPYEVEKNPNEVYRLKVSEELFPELNEILIQYGYGDRVGSIYYQLAFKNISLIDGAFELEIKKDGVSVGTSYEAFAFVQGENPVDATSPVITEVNYDDTAKISTLKFSDNDKIKESVCGYATISGEELKVVGITEFLPYTGPMKSVNDKGGILGCIAYDESGNSTMWWGDDQSRKQQKVLEEVINKDEDYSGFAE